MIQVETIGDCYLAITGLPEPRRDHAVAMVRFAKEISNKMVEVTNKLEESLGPDTATLQIRIGKFRLSVGRPQMEPVDTAFDLI